MNKKGFKSFHCEKCGRRDFNEIGELMEHVESCKKEEKPIMTYKQIIEMAFQIGRIYGVKEFVGSEDFIKFRIDSMNEIDSEFHRTKANESAGQGWQCF